MARLLRLFFILLVRSLRSRHHLLLENLALRQQVLVLARHRPRPRFPNADRFLGAMLRRFWPRWQSALILVQPETVVGWHRTGFKLYWTWLCRLRKRAGRKCVSRELRELIFHMIAENRTWGAPRIHGEWSPVPSPKHRRTTQRHSKGRPRKNHSQPPSSVPKPALCPPDQMAAASKLTSMGL